MLVSIARRIMDQSECGGEGGRRGREEREGEGGRESEDEREGGNEGRE